MVFKTYLAEHFVHLPGEFNNLEDEMKEMFMFGLKY
jgi:hypothetical protein